MSLRESDSDRSNPVIKLFARSYGIASSPSRSLRSLRLLAMTILFPQSPSRQLPCMSPIFYNYLPINNHLLNSL